MEILLRDLTQRVDQHHVQNNRPFITLSYAQSLDGSLTPWPGRPFPISSPETRTLTHTIRAHHDAILIGIGTLLADDPRLTARRVSGKNPQPVVLDSHLRSPVDARLLEHEHPPWIMTTQMADTPLATALMQAGAKIISLPADAGGRVSLPALLDELGQRGIRSIMVEGGAAVLTSFLQHNFVDWLALTVSLRLMGGLHAVGELNKSNPDAFPRLADARFATVGPDLVIWGAFRA